MSWISPDHVRGGLVAMDLVSAIIAEDPARIGVLAAQTGDDPAGVITALSTSLAQTLQANLGKAEAQRQLGVWAQALVEGATSCED